VLAEAVVWLAEVEDVFQSMFSAGMMMPKFLFMVILNGPLVFESLYSSY
jgi:hypothetical protein